MCMDLHRAKVQMSMHGKTPSIVSRAKKRKVSRTLKVQSIVATDCLKSRKLEICSSAPSCSGLSTCATKQPRRHSNIFSLARVLIRALINARHEMRSIFLAWPLAPPRPFSFSTPISTTPTLRPPYSAEGEGARTVDGLAERAIGTIRLSALVSDTHCGETISDLPPSGGSQDARAHQWAGRASLLRLPSFTFLQAVPERRDNN